MTMMSLQEAMELAISQHRSGQVSQAESIYRQVLSKQPNNPAALHLMGMVNFQAGKLEEALDWMDRAIAIEPNVADFHVNRGVVLDGLGQLDLAISAYRRAAELKQNVPEIHANLGNVLRKSGRLDEAALECRRAIELRPEYFEAHLNLGNVLQDLGELDQAISEFSRVIELRSDFAEGYHNLGNALHKRGRIDEAISAQQKALHIKPDFAQAANALAVALRSRNLGDEAIAAWQSALRMNPNLVPALVNLAQSLREKSVASMNARGVDVPPPALEDAVAMARKAVYLSPQSVDTHLILAQLLLLKKDLPAAVTSFRQVVALKPRSVEANAGLAKCLALRGEYESAIAAYHETLSIDPNFAEGYHGLGAILSEHGDYDRAVAALRRAVSLRPDSLEMTTLLATTLSHRGDFEEALSWFKRVLELDPNYANGHWNLALMLLTRGDFERGWQEYEWRWKVKDLDMTFNATAPVWDGGNIDGRRILLVGEQGFGDAIQCARFIPQVAERGGKIILAVHSELRKLIEQSPVGREVIEWVIPDQNLPKYDVYCPLLTLPKVLGTRLENIPANVPYLKADEGEKQKWRSRMPTDGRRKVGLTWAGRPKHVNDWRRSIPAELLAPLAEASNVWFCNLQKGPVARDARPPLEMADWTSEINDFADTAALIDNLDLIITADTAMAHLAGAMGKKVWVLLPLLPDWRWMLHRTDSPWYPTMRLFRQTVAGDWTTPIAEVVQALKNT